MDKFLLIILAAVAIYIMFRALKSTLDIIFKITIIILIISFMGYNILDYKYALVPATSEIQGINETAYYPEENLTASNPTAGNANITSEQNATEGMEKNTTET